MDIFYNQERIHPKGVGAMNKTIKGAVLFLILFLLTAVGITYFSIQKANHGTETVAENREQGIDLYGTYDENDLLVEELLENYNGVEIKIPQISGLKDKEVQDKVNNDIYAKCHGLLDEFETVNYAVYTERANFGNTLSISFYVGSETSYDQIYMNYELIHGNELYLEDLFMEDTDITEIVRKAFYQTLVKDSEYTSESPVVSPDENELYKAVKGYMESDLQEFTFSPAEIAFYYKDYVAGIRMVDIPDKVSIYAKYMTDESIFEKDGIGYDDIFTCADTQYGAFDLIDYGYLEPNFWYDVTAGQMWTEDIDEEKLKAFNEFKSEMYEAAFEKVEEYGEIARNNPDKFYILLAKPDVSLYFDQEYNNGEWAYVVSNVASVNENYQIYEMPMELYESTYKDRIIDTYRYVYFAMRGGAYLDPYEDHGADVTNIYETKLYNYNTKEELTEFADIFYEDSGYMEVIEGKTREFLGYQNYSEAYIEQLMDTAEYKIEGTTIVASIPSAQNFYVSVFFDEFDKEMLKIFD